MNAVRENYGTAPAPSSSAQAENAFVGLRYHFIGVGGIGMSSLARLLIAWGAVVSGSDRSDSEMMETLRAEGAAVWVGHDAEHIKETTPEVVVYSKAVPDENPELAAARAAGIRVIHRAELLRELMSSRKAVCICGTHGKSTTTAMLSQILTDAGEDPAMMLGGVYGPVGGNVRNGRGSVFVAEACEAYGSFLSLYPDLAVVTNIEPDHLDQGATFDDIRDSFRVFLQRVPEEGVVVACGQSVEVVRLLPNLRARVRTYGLIKASSDANTNLPDALDWTAVPFEDGYEVRTNCDQAPLRLRVPGEHNVLNALAAIAAADALGIPLQESIRSLARFTGVDRRFSIRGAAGGVLVIDDYAHHPTEIRASLAAAREVLVSSSSQDLPDNWRPAAAGRLIAAFQPHLYSRTALFREEFATAFETADIVVLTEIYAARETPIPGVSGADLAERVHARCPEKPVSFVEDLIDLPGRLAELARPGDLILAMGAGDITTISVPLMNGLGAKARESERNGR